jgi:hypothetical protein
MSGATVSSSSYCESKNDKPIRLTARIADRYNLNTSFLTQLLINVIIDVYANIVFVLKNLSQKTWYTI